MRIQFYDGIWSGIPGTGECYIIPVNPYSFDPVDRDGAEWSEGFNLGGRHQTPYDSRERNMVWANLPAFPVYITMLNTLAGYTGRDSIYVNLGNSLLPGLYATGDDWYQINVTQVFSTNANGSNVTKSGGQVYNKFASVTLLFEIMGEAE